MGRKQSGPSQSKYEKYSESRINMHKTKEKYKMIEYIDEERRSLEHIHDRIKTTVFR